MAKHAHVNCMCVCVSKEIKNHIAQNVIYKLKFHVNFYKQESITSLIHLLFTYNLPVIIKTKQIIIVETVVKLNVCASASALVFVLIKIILFVVFFTVDLFVFSISPILHLVFSYAFSILFVTFLLSAKLAFAHKQCDDEASSKKVIELIYSGKKLLKRSCVLYWV